MRPLCLYFYLLCFPAILFILTNCTQNYAHRFNEVMTVIVKYSACVQLHKLMLIVVMKPKQRFKVVLSKKKGKSRCVLFNAYCIGAGEMFPNNHIAKLPSGLALVCSQKTCLLR